CGPPAATSNNGSVVVHTSYRPALGRSGVKSAVSTGSHETSVAASKTSIIKGAWSPKRGALTLGLYHLRTLRRNEGYGVRGRLSGGLYSPAQGRTGVRGRGHAVYPSRRVHRLRRVRSGVPGRGDLRARR